MRRTILKHTFVAVLAASALAASPALARSVDRVDRFESRTSSLAGTSMPKQDLRGELARDAARAAEPQFMPGQPTWPIHPAPAAPPTDAVPTSDSGSDGGSWLVLGIALAATALIGGSAAGVARRYRLRVRRVAA